MLIKATIAGGGVIPHIHKSLLEKQQTHVIPESTTWMNKNLKLTKFWKTQEPI